MTETSFNFHDGKGSVPAHQHPNGGGWVANTAHVDESARVYGDAQVYGNAWVYGNARVYGDAWVYGDARVYGDAWVYGDARVYGDAWVYGKVKVEKTPIVVTGLRYTITICGKTAHVGCECHAIAKWRKFKPEKIANMDGASATEFYPKLIKLFDGLGL